MSPFAICNSVLINIKSFPVHHCKQLLYKNLKLLIINYAIQHNRKCSCTENCLFKKNKSFIPSNKSTKFNDSCKNMNTIHSMDYVGSLNDASNVIFSSVSAFFPFSFKEAFRL